jgi:endo-1,3(4)-beta-glucanase
MARMARLALIADELGIADARAAALAAIETTLLPWLTGENLDYLSYDKTYGGIIPLFGIGNQFADYGAGWYSDHHFHYGYFVYVFAVLSRLDAQFADAHRGTLDAFVRDYCNLDATDTDFPFARHKDFFDGHSWASGLLIQANGKSQESSSESVNAYYSAFLYGQQTNNIDLMRFAQTLLAMEVQSTLAYWHMPSESDVYDPIFAANKMAGNLCFLAFRYEIA